MAGVNCIVNELLSSANHAINTGKLTLEIVDTFSVFYDHVEVKDAYEAFGDYVSNSHPGIKWSRSSKVRDKNEARTNDLVKIIDQMRLLDWQQTPMPFVSCDLNRICSVFGSLRDEIQMRGELQRMESRMNALEVLCNKLPNLSEKLDLISKKIDQSNSFHAPNTADGDSKPTQNTIPNSTTKVNVNLVDSLEVSAPTDEACGLRGDEKRVTVGTCLQNLILPVQPSNENESFHTPGEEPPSPSWKTHTNRRKRDTPSSKPVKRGLCFGKNECDLMSADFQPGKIFVSRCHVNTTAEMLQQYLQQKWNWKILNVKSINVKFDTYKSFLIILDKASKDIDQFLVPDFWPKGWVIREWTMKPARARKPKAKTAPVDLQEPSKA